MTKSELVNLLDHLYPFSNQEDWDQCGYDRNQDLNQRVEGILVSLDLNKISLKDAIEHHCNAIITHHPLFKTNPEHPEDLIINRVNYEMFTTLNQHQILHIALHTCFDRDIHGTSYQIAKHVPGLVNLRPLPNNPYVIVADLLEPIKVNDFLVNLKSLQQFSSLRYLEQQKNITIKQIAIGAGSCSSYLNEVYLNKVDCFLTGDVKWHGYQDAYNAGIVMIDINHDAEQVFIPTIVEHLRSNHELQNTLIRPLFNTLKIKEFK